MTADQTREEKLVEYLKRVTGDLVEAKERLRAVEAAATEPVAVVGMSCRLPGGGDTPARYWQALHDGVDAMTDVPADRWNAADYYDPDPTAPGKAYTQRGGFLPDIAGWDAAFFGISPQEALRIDPQHRMLYELAWEALEDAGIAAETLRGTRTGVFLGLVDSRQYLQLEAELEGMAGIDDPYLTMGGSPSAAAGRLAYHFDLRGPTMTVDTACSSALVALDLAVASLRRGDCDHAVVCSSSAIIHPVYFVQFAKMGMLAPDGRAKVFDQDGNGYTLGEGGGAVVLTRASTAERAGNRTHALIRGTAVNSDGRSNGLTAPNKQAQVAVLRTALANAGLRPDDLDFLEAQGTGSALGDAIEFGALLEVFGDRDRPDPLLVGAVKANIGHLVASSGLASLIKSILAVKHGEVPANLHLTTPNPVVTLDGPVRPVQGRQVLRGAPDTPRRAGVSAFGWSGTNAHVIIEQAPEPPSGAPEPERAGQREWQLLTVSAGSEASLRAATTALADHLESTPDLPLADVARTVQTGRAALRMRRALVCRDAADAVARLREEGGDRAHTPGGRQTAGLLLTGDTDLAAVADLAGTEPVLRAALDECGAPAGTAASAFAAEYAIGTLLAASGVQVAAVSGTGAGALAADCVAGVRSVADGLAAAHALDRGETPAPAAAAGVPRIPVAPSGEDLAARVDVVVTLGAAAGPRQVALRPGGGPLGRPEWLTALGRLWELGVPVDWTAGCARGRLVDLPTYPFQRTRFWPQRVAQPETAPGTGTAAAPAATGVADTAVEVVPAAQRYARPDMRTPFLPPRTAVERTVAEIWQDYLGIDAIGVHDPFFELGGTSVAGVAVVNRLAKEFDVELTAASLFERPTVDRFADLLTTLQAETDPAAAAPPAAGLDVQSDRGSRRRALAGAAAKPRNRRP
jgi:polyketide synthase 12